MQQAVGRRRVVAPGGSSKEGSEGQFVGGAESGHPRVPTHRRDVRDPEHCGKSRGPSPYRSKFETLYIPESTSFDKSTAT